MKKEAGNTSLYIRDKDLYLNRVSKVKELWFSLYQEHLSTSDVIQRGLEILVSTIENEEELRKSVNTRKISDKYARVGE